MLWLHQEKLHTKSKQDVSQTREDVARIRGALKAKIVSNYRACKFLETHVIHHADWQETQAERSESTNWFEAPLIVGEHYSSRQRFLCSVVLVDHWLIFFNCDEN